MAQSSARAFAFQSLYASKHHSGIDFRLQPATVTVLPQAASRLRA
jgi:hypothetical protein